MTVRQAIPVALSLVVAAGALAPALAAPPKPKPISEEYAVEGLPVPVPLAGIDGVDGTNSCTDPHLEGISTTTKTIKTTGPGTLAVDVTDFDGDWDITVMDDKGNVLGVGSGTATPTALATPGDEKAVIKTKKAMTLNIAVCNFLGGPTANAKYVFTYK
jgi:hypothetical protein